MKKIFNIFIYNEYSDFKANANKVEGEKYKVYVITFLALKFKFRFRQSH